MPEVISLVNKEDGVVGVILYIKAVGELVEILQRLFIIVCLVCGYPTQIFQRIDHQCIAGLIVLHHSGVVIRSLVIQLLASCFLISLFRSHSLPPTFSCYEILLDGSKRFSTVTRDEAESCDGHQ